MPSSPVRVTGNAGAGVGVGLVAAVWGRRRHGRDRGERDRRARRRPAGAGDAAAAQREGDRRQQDGNAAEQAAFLRADGDRRNTDGRPPERDGLGGKRQIANPYGFGTDRRRGLSERSHGLPTSLSKVQTCAVGKPELRPRGVHRVAGLCRHLTDFATRRPFESGTVPRRPRGRPMPTRPLARARLATLRISDR